MKKIKVFFVTTDLPSRKGGANVRNLNLLKYIDKNKFSVSLFTILDKETKKQLPLLEKELDMPIYSVNYKYLSFFSQVVTSFIKRTVPYMKEYELSGIADLVMEKIEEDKPDIIHIEQFNTYFALRKLIPYFKENNIKIVFDQHNVEFIAFSEGIKSHNILKKIAGKVILPKFKKIEYEAIDNSDYLFACSEIDKKHFKKTTKIANIDVIPNGVDCDYFKANKPVRENSLLFMGGTVYPPNNEALRFFFSKVYPQVKQAVPDISIYVLGANPKQWLLKLAQGDSSIQVLGQVPDVRTYIENAKIGICPIKSGSGTRLKVLEYLASGKAVVSTRKGAEGIEVTNEKNILFADDAKEFVNKIISLCTNQNRVKELGNEARDLILEKYQWKNIVRDMENGYRKVLSLKNKKLKKKTKKKKNSINKELFSPQRKILYTLFTLGIVINSSIIFPISTFYISSILASILLLVFPGLLLLWITFPKNRDPWEIVTYTIGFSISTLMLLGLLINYALPLLKITAPLSMLPVLLSLDSLVILLWTYLTIINKPFPLDINAVKLSKKDLIFSILPITFPLLSILGAISLNNQGSDIFTMILLGLIAVVVLFLTIVRNKINEKLFPFTILMIGLSLLFMTSLRGWYITGHDIFQEYYVFQLTQLHHLWSMVFFQSPYTACLSITMLPTMISSITNIPDMYIYKILYQVIFAFSVVVTYLFLRKFIKPFLAFLGTFIVISLPTFMTDMPMLNRQEIALLFFALLLNSLFTNGFSQKLKWFIFLLFGLGLTFSHYSTTYVSLSLFTITSIIYLMISFIRFHPNIKKIMSFVDNKLGIEHHKANVHLVMVIILFIVAVFWNFNVTHTAQGITQTIINIQKDLTLKHFTNGKNDPASYSLINSKKPTDKQLLSNYVTTLTAYVRKFNTDNAFYDKSIYSQYSVTNGSQAKLPLTSLGKTLTHFHINVFTLNDELKQFYAKLVQIFIVIGFISIFWYKKYIKNLKKEHIILIFVFFGLIILQTVLPGSSISYGILRLLQQGLILLVIPLIIGALTLFSIFDKIHKSIKIYILSIIFVFFFLYLSGFISQITGGYYASLNLANKSFYYEAYYTHRVELASISWLMNNRAPKIPIQSDRFALNKIHTYGNVYSVDGIIPSTIRINSYVYLSYSNNTTGQIMTYVNGAPIYYYFPMNFLDQNKNLIYNNGGTKIYR